jgi:hypothetical protein
VRNNPRHTRENSHTDTPAGAERKIDDEEVVVTVDRLRLIFYSGFVKMMLY